MRKGPKRGGKNQLLPPRAPPRWRNVLVLLVPVRRRCGAVRSALDDGRAVAEARAEEDVRVREEALLERHDDELRALEARAEELPDVLRVREVERRVDLVEDVHWRGLELEEGHDQGERDERPGERARVARRKGRDVSAQGVSWRKLNGVGAAAWLNTSGHVGAKI